MTDSPPPGGAPRLGRAMVYAAWLLVLGLLTLFFNDRVERQRNPNRILTSTQSANAVEVTLERNRYGHYNATGAINGQPVEFMLDTGATLVSVPAGLADRLGLKRGAPGVSETANGRVTTYATRLAHLTLGGIELDDVRASINPGMQGEEILLGMSVLKHLEFTQRGDTLTLRQYRDSAAP